MGYKLEQPTKTLPGVASQVFNSNKIFFLEGIISSANPDQA